ncbi:alkylation response protein AidB-like acyl-CoA dehydrogenase [Pseudomonas sp. PvP125]
MNYVDPEGRTHLGIGAGVAGDPRIERKPFWSVPHLQAADSHEVRFNNLVVPDAMMHFSTALDDQLGDTEQGMGSHVFAIWFQLLASASYLGMACALASRALLSRKGSPEDRALLLIDLQVASRVLAFHPSSRAASSAFLCEQLS